MSSGSRQSLCKLSCSDGTEYYTLTTVHEDGEEGIDVTLCDGKEAWAGSVTGDNMKKMAKKIKMNVSDFRIQTCKALTRENVGNLNFVYQAKDTGDKNIDLIWKKHMASDNIKFQLGSMLLEHKSSPSDVIRVIFEHAIKSAESLQERITALQSDSERLASERGTAIKRLEKCVAAKEQLETDLYAKFVTVLNDKKQKMRELREEGACSASSSQAPKASTSKGPAAAGTRSDSDETGDERLEMEDKSGSEYDTDEDSKRKDSIAVKKKVIDSVGDLSLLLDDGLQDDDEVPLPTKRRRRGAASSGKKPMPSKPVLPKVTSGEGRKKTPRQSSKPSSLRKSGSNASSKSNRSSDNLDEDALLDDF